MCLSARAHGPVALRKPHSSLLFNTCCSQTISDKLIQTNSFIACPPPLPFSQVAFGDGCDTVKIDLNSGESEIAETLGDLESLAGRPLRVSVVLSESSACSAQGRDAQSCRELDLLCMGFQSLIGSKNA